MTTSTPDARAITPARRWSVLAGATALLQFAWWPAVYEVAAAEGGAGRAGGFALALAVMPMVAGVVAFGSRRDDAPMGVLKAMGVFILIGLPLGLFDVVIGLSVGFAAAGAVSLRGPEVIDTGRLRWVAVGSLLVWLALLLTVAPGFAIMSGAVLPLLVLGIVDQAAEDRARDSAT